MKRKILLLPALALFAIFSACDYEPVDVVTPEENIPENPGEPTAPEVPTSQQFHSLQDTALENIKQEFTFDASQSSVTLTSAKGVQITLYPGCLTKNGVAVTGNVDLEYVEVFNRGNMLTTNRPTMGLLPNGDRGLLISGGEFYINATQDGVQLEMGCGMQLMVPTSLTGGLDNDMSIWFGNEDEDGDLVWDEVNNDNPQGQQEAGVGGEGGNYYCYFNHFGWTNVDRFYNDPRPKTTIYVDVPEGYDDTNCAVYLAYLGEGSALALLDTYNEDTELFSEHYGLIPIGLECFVIFVSEDDGEWTYAIKAVTIVADQIITIDDADLDSVTEAELIALIDALP
jgi:hypothetical protein